MRIHLVSPDGHTRAELEPEHGGRVVSLVINEFDVLGKPDDAPSSPDFFRGIFPLAPWAGRLPDGTITLDGRTYPVTNHTDLMHGLVAESRWAVFAKTRGAVGLRTHLGEPWPFSGSLVQRIRLANNRLAMEVSAFATDARMPVALGLHPWFRAAGTDGAPAAVEFHPRARLVPTGSHQRWRRTADLGRRPWDDLFTDVEHPLSIGWNGGPRILLTSSAGIWVYYERMHGAFCLEPWTASPSDVQLGLCDVATPGAPVTMTFSIRWDSAGNRMNSDTDGAGVSGTARLGPAVNRQPHRGRQGSRPIDDRVTAHLASVPHAA